MGLSAAVISAITAGLEAAQAAAAPVVAAVETAGGAVGGAVSGISPTALEIGTTGFASQGGGAGGGTSLAKAGALGVKINKAARPIIAAGAGLAGGNAAVQAARDASESADAGDISKANAELNAAVEGRAPTAEEIEAGVNADQARGVIDQVRGAAGAPPQSAVDRAATAVGDRLSSGVDFVKANPLEVLGAAGTGLGALSLLRTPDATAPTAPRGRSTPRRKRTQRRGRGKGDTIITGPLGVIRPTGRVQRPSASLPVRATLG